MYYCIAIRICDTLNKRAAAVVARAVHRARHRASGFRTQRQLTPSQTQSATKYHPARQLSAFGENSLLLRSDEGVNPVRRKHWDFSSRDLKCSVIYQTRRQKGMRTIQKSTFKWGSNKSHARPLSWSLRTGFSIDYIFRTEIACLDRSTLNLEIKLSSLGDWESHQTRVTISENQKHIYNHKEEKIDKMEVAAALLDASRKLSSEKDNFKGGSSTGNMSMGSSSSFSSGNEVWSRSVFSQFSQ